MNIRTEDQTQADILSATSGRVDALAAAVFGILELSKSIPELAVAIKENLEEKYANRLVDSEDPRYIQAFVDTRAQLLKILR